MANAIAQQVPGSMNVTASGFTMTYQIVYSGTDVANGSDASEATVDFSFGDSPVNMGTKIGAAVRTEGNRLGYSVGANAVITPGFTKV